MRLWAQLNGCNAQMTTIPLMVLTAGDPNSGSVIEFKNSTGLAEALQEHCSSHQMVFSPDKQPRVGERNGQQWRLLQVLSLSLPSCTV